MSAAPMVNGGCFVADNLQLNDGVQLHEDTRMQPEYELTKGTGQVAARWYLERNAIQ
jgi:hypothetical protein